MRGWRTRGAVLVTVLAVLLGLVPGASWADDGGERIIGGSRVDEGVFPWMVRLSMGCGGSLVAPSVVLTAGHCVRRTGADTTIGVTGGSIDLESERAKTIRSTYVYRAPGYAGAEKGGDWALIQLATPFDLPSITLPTSTVYDEGEFTVMGWGSTRDGSITQQRRLRSVEVDFVPDSTCGRRYAKLGLELVETDMICAGNLRAGGKDSCQGDSGGPMVRLDATGSWVQIGIVSWGYGCGKKNYPGVYGQVSTFAAGIVAGMATLKARLV